MNLYTEWKAAAAEAFNSIGRLAFVSGVLALWAFSAAVALARQGYAWIRSQYMRFTAAVILSALCLAPVTAQSQCPGGRCPTPGLGLGRVLTAPTTPAAQAVKVECYSIEGKPADRWYLRVNGQVIGHLTESTGILETTDGNRWEFKLPCSCDCPQCPECPSKSSADTVPTFAQVPPGGVDPEHLGTVERYTINGQEVPEARAFEALESSNLVDDSKALRVTVIGPTQARARVLADLKGRPELAGMILKDYAPDAWEVCGLGYITDGNPTVYVQSAAGQVLHRQDEYDGPEPLLGAIRKARDYDPKKDPDLRKPEPTPTPEPTPAPVPTPEPEPFTVPTWLILAAVAAAAFYFGMRTSNK